MIIPRNWETSQHIYKKSTFITKMEGHNIGSKLENFCGIVKNALK